MVVEMKAAKEWYDLYWQDGGPYMSLEDLVDAVREEMRAAIAAKLRYEADAVWRRMDASRFDHNRSVSCGENAAYLFAAHIAEDLGR